MKKIFPVFILLLIFSCNNIDTEMKSEIEDLKQRLAASKDALQKATSDETAFIHTVFFWMNEDVTDQQKADFAKNGLGKLIKVPSIYKGYFGPPAMTPREVVDNSYDFALICHFKNKEDQNTYQKDADHLKFIEDYKNLWKRVQVYDNLLMD